MEPNDYVEANRKSWNERAAIHAGRRGKEFEERIRRADFSTFDDVEERIFAQIGLKGKYVIQPCCNNGRELISVKKAGAGRCVGVDLSDRFIEEARRLAALSGVEVEFLRSSVYDIPRELDGNFDLVYITIGALGWLPDLDRFFEIVSRLLRRNGQVFIYETHPILNMFESGKGLAVEHSYFKTEPFEDTGQPDYLDRSQTVQSVAYWFPHKLYEIIGGCLHHGLALTHFEEYGHDLSMEFAELEQLDKKPPLSFSLVARKTT